MAVLLPEWPLCLRTGTSGARGRSRVAGERWVQGLGNEKESRSPLFSRLRTSPFCFYFGRGRRDGGGGDVGFESLASRLAKAAALMGLGSLFSAGISPAPLVWVAFRTWPHADRLLKHHQQNAGISQNRARSGNTDPIKAEFLDLGRVLTTVLSCFTIGACAKMTSGLTEPESLT